MCYFPFNWVAHLAPHLRRAKLVRIMRKARILVWLVIIPLIILKRKVVPHLNPKRKGFPLPPHPLLLPKRKRYLKVPKKKKFPHLVMGENQSHSRNVWNISKNDAFPTLNRRQGSSTIITNQKVGSLAKAQSKNGRVASQHGSATTQVGDQCGNSHRRDSAWKKFWDGWKRIIPNGTKNTKEQKI